MKKISCVIAAYNEAPRIGDVLKVVAPLIGKNLYEVIVIDDGSGDGTSKIVRKFRKVKLIVLDLNSGKSKAVARGILEATGDYILLLDADLYGIAKKDIINLIKPIEDGESNSSMSIRANSSFWMRLIDIDFISGERVISRDLLTENIGEIIATKNFGLEVFINKLLITSKTPLAIVKWNNVYNVIKIKKRGVLKGSIGEVKMLTDIFDTVSILGSVKQNFQLKKLTKK